MSKAPVFIYGSCVSRDTFEYLDRDQFQLECYVARQSMLSAYSTPVTLIRAPEFESPFQQRVVQGDFASDLRHQIATHATRTDLVLVDLVDERLGVYLLPDGSVVTRSPELIASGYESLLPEGSYYLPFGDDRHFEYWSAAVTSVGQMFQRHMPRAGIALLDIAWAVKGDHGEQAPTSFGMDARQANLLYRRYVAAAAAALNAKVISIGPDEVTSSRDHPWGEAPFHYSRRVYESIVALLTGRSNQISRREHSPAAHKGTTSDRPPSEAPATPSDSPGRPESDGATAERSRADITPAAFGPPFANLDADDDVISSALQRLNIDSEALRSGVTALTVVRERADDRVLAHIFEKLPVGSRLVVFTTNAVKSRNPLIRPQYVPASTEEEFRRKIARHIEKLTSAGSTSDDGHSECRRELQRAHARIADLERQLRQSDTTPISE